MNDLQIGGAMLNASRNAAKARELAQKQLEEARIASDYARETARAAKDGARAEQERLALEQERNAAERHERLLRAQTLERQTQARGILADAIVEYGELTALTAYPPEGVPERSWSRRLALLQGRVLILEGFRDVLTELSDMTESRKLKSQVSAFVRAQVEKGFCPADPWQAGQSELDGLRRFADEARTAAGTAMQFGSRVLSSPMPPMTYDAWQEAQREGWRRREKLPAQLAALREKSHAEWWDPAGKLSADLESLLIFTALLSGDGKPAKGGTTPEAEVLELGECGRFALAKGAMYDGVVAHLDEVAERLTLLGQQHDADSARWARALELTAQANDGQAEALLQTCSNQVTDADFERCGAEIKAWQDRLRMVAEEPRLTQLRTNVLADNLPILPWRIAGEARARRAILDEASAWTQVQVRASGQYQGSDFGNRLNATLAKHARTVSEASKELDRRVRNHRIWTAAIPLATALFVAGCIVFSSWAQRQAEEAQREEIARAAEDERQVKAAQEAVAARQADAVRRAEEAEKVRQAEAAQQAEVARQAEAQEEARKQDEAKRQVALERAHAADLAAEREKRKQAVIDRGGQLYGTGQLNIQLSKGTVAMRRGASYTVLARYPNHVLNVRPDNWGQQGTIYWPSIYGGDAVHQPYPESYTVNEISQEMERGIEVQENVLSVDNPDAIPGLPDGY